MVSGRFAAQLSAPGALIRGRPPPPTQRRRGHDPHLRDPVDGHRDQRCPDRDPAHVVLRPIDRVDHPGPSGTHRTAVLLAHQRVLGALGGEDLPQRRLHRAIRVGDRSHVRFCAHLQVRLPVAGHADGVSGISQTQCQGEVIHGSRLEIEKNVAYAFRERVNVRYIYKGDCAADRPSGTAGEYLYRRSVALLSTEMPDQSSSRIDANSRRSDPSRAGSIPVAATYSSRAQSTSSCVHDRGQSAVPGSRSPKA